MVLTTTLQPETVTINTSDTLVFIAKKTSSLLSTGSSDNIINIGILGSLVSILDAFIFIGS